MDVKLRAIRRALRWMRVAEKAMMAEMRAEKRKGERQVAALERARERGVASQDAPSAKASNALLML